MSFCGVLLIFLALFASGITHYGHRNEHKLYPISVDLTNGWSQSELYFMVPKNIARYAKNLMDCLPQDNANAMTPLENMEDLFLTVRTSSWEELKNRACQMNWLSEFRRKWNARPLVELFPGTYKHELYDYNPEDLGKDLKRLAALKKKQADRTKDLNAGTES